ncbi:MAG: hypothetical protein ABW088_00590 [Sedimenticola sp.]
MVYQTQIDEDQISILAGELSDCLGEDYGERYQHAAYYILHACHCAEWMGDGFRTIKEFSPTLKDQRRQLERLTRKNPREDSFSNLSGQASFWLEKAIIRLGLYTADWRERDLTELSEAAELAITMIPDGAPKTEDYPGEILIASIAVILKQFLNVLPSASHDSTFRKLLVVSLKGSRFQREEYKTDNAGSSKRIRRAIDRMESGALKYSPYIQFANFKK